MIVKVQMPLNEKKDPDALVLIYNESRDWKSVIPVSDKIRDMMKGRLTAFFDMDSDPHGGLTFNGEVSWQDW